MSRRVARKIAESRVQISITLPRDLLYELDELAKELEFSRSDVIEEILQYCFELNLIDEEIFPFEEGEESETEQEESEENEGES
jgi:predicted transcriptional regulator